jgi:DNA-binding transcriptional regulator YiaG
MQNMGREAEKKDWDSFRVRALRKHMGLTQAELSERLGTRQQTVSEWELGMYQPRGASSTLLNIIARETRFDYSSTAPGVGKKKS